MELIELRTLSREYDQQVIKCIHKSVKITNSPDYSPNIIDYQINTHYTMDWLTRKMGSSFFIIALIDGKVVGTGSLDDNEVKAVFVDPDFQRMGVGRAIMGVLEKYAGSKGLREIILNSSITAFGFYGKLGYEFVEESTNMYQGEKIITYLMKKLLIS